MKKKRVYFFPDIWKKITESDKQSSAVYENTESPRSTCGIISAVPVRTDDASDGKYQEGEGGRGGSVIVVTNPQRFITLTALLPQLCKLYQHPCHDVWFDGHS